MCSPPGAKGLNGEYDGRARARASSKRKFERVGFASVGFDCHVANLSFLSLHGGARGLTESFSIDRSRSPPRVEIDKRRPAAAAAL